MEKIETVGKIIIVDDEETIVWALKETLLDVGYEVFAYDNPIKVLETIGKVGCDVLITDICMPEMDGIDLLCKVKEQFPNIIQFSVKGTKDPQNITKTTRTMESKINESSQQTPGLESSVLKFTEFGNMTGQLNPQGPDQRQDDFANQFKRQTKYLTKTSKEILDDKKKRKKRIKR